MSGDWVHRDLKTLASMGQRCYVEGEPVGTGADEGAWGGESGPEVPEEVSSEEMSYLDSSS